MSIFEHSNSIFEYPCPKCGRARIIPNGSMNPRCRVCEPDELFLEAAAAWERAQKEKQRLAEGSEG